MTIDEKLDFIIEKLQQHDVEFTHLSQDVRGIKLHLENVTDKNINIIGEGHRDLS